MKTSGRTERPEIEIKIWMLRNDLTMVKIAKDYGAGKRFVSQFVRGVKTSKGLAKYMLGIGCPEKYIRDGKVVTATAENQA